VYLHRTAALRLHYETKSITWTQRRLRQQFNVPRHVILSHSRLLLWIHKFEDNGSVGDSPHGGPRNMRTKKTLAEQMSLFIVVHVAQLSKSNTFWI